MQQRVREVNCTTSGCAHRIDARVAILVERFHPARHPVIERHGLDLGDVNTHVAMDAAAAQANEAAHIDGGPCWSFGTAISASFVLILTEKGGQCFLGLFSLLLRRFFRPVRAVCHYKCSQRIHTLRCE